MCCRDGIRAPRGYDVLAFGLDTQWFLWEEGGGNEDIPNPIPYLTSIAHSWDIGLFTSEGKYLRDKSGYISGQELLVSIAGLEDGKYFIEIEHEKSFFHSAFQIGGVTDTPTSSGTSSRNN